MSKQVQKTDCIIAKESKDVSFVPIENILTDMVPLEQYVSKVLSYSSKYSLTGSIAYSPENLLWKCQRYPGYGDFVETYILRSYGFWYKFHDTHLGHFRPQDSDPYGAEDYITVGFETPVVPRHVFIYETYNPGAVVRIWGRLTGKSWKILWEGPPQKCDPEARKFQPEIKKYNCLINELRLELNQVHLNYHTAMDAILLGGLEPSKKIMSNPMFANLIKTDLITVKNDDLLLEIEEECHLDKNTDKQDFITALPYEITLHIFKYLDLISLCKSSQVCKMWYEISLDPLLYQNLSLQKYWSIFNTSAVNFLRQRTGLMKKLDVSWCDTSEHEISMEMARLVHDSRDSLTHFVANHCNFINSPISNPNSILMSLSDCGNLVDLRIRGAILEGNDYRILEKLQNLETLDVCYCNIKCDALGVIMKSNRNLKHLLMDHCVELDVDHVVQTAVLTNPELSTFSVFKTPKLTARGFAFMHRLGKLRELDLGWCFDGFMASWSEQAFEALAVNCPHLERLVLSQWHDLTERNLRSIVKNCKKLTQLDLLGVQSVSNELLLHILQSLPNLKLLDVSYCHDVPGEAQMKITRQQFPLVTIHAFKHVNIPRV